MAFVVAAAGAFTATNIDDLVVLVVTYQASLQSRAESVRIAVGQYLGMSAVTLASLAVASGLASVDHRLVKWLGIIPITLGLVRLVRLVRSARAGRGDRADVRPMRTGVLSVTLLVASLGSDNVAVYVTQFHHGSIRQNLTVIATYAVLTGVWCVLAAAVSKRSRASRRLTTAAPRVIPFLYIAIGCRLLT